MFWRFYFLTTLDVVWCWPKSKKFAKQIQDIAEKTPLDPPILPTDEHTIDGATPSPLPQPSIVLNTPTNPEVQPETNTDKPNNQGDIVSMLDRWLKS